MCSVLICKPRTNQSLIKAMVRSQPGNQSNPCIKVLKKMIFDKFNLIRFCFFLRDDAGGGAGMRFAAAIVLP